MDYENIRHDAEQSTRKWNTIYLIVMIILLGYIGIRGISLLSKESDFIQGLGIQLIFIAVIGIISVKLFTNLVDTLTNISVKLDKLESMQRTLKKIESNQDRLTKHLDN